MAINDVFEFLASISLIVNLILFVFFVKRDSLVIWVVLKIRRKTEILQKDIADNLSKMAQIQVEKWKDSGMTNEQIKERLNNAERRSREEARRLIRQCDKI